MRRKSSSRHIYRPVPTMAKPALRSYSRYARDATALLGLMIRSARIERKFTISDVAERAGISRGLVHRIEKGEMGSSIGAAFEVAAIVGLRLFEPDRTPLTHRLISERDKLTLLPQSVRTGITTVKDDF